MLTPHLRVDHTYLVISPQFFAFLVDELVRCLCADMSALDLFSWGLAKPGISKCKDARGGVQDNGLNPRSRTLSSTVPLSVCSSPSRSDGVS